MSFVDCQTNMVRLAKQLAKTAQEMVSPFFVVHRKKLACYLFVLKSEISKSSKEIIIV